MIVVWLCRPGTSFDRVIKSCGYERRLAFRAVTYNIQTSRNGSINESICLSTQLLTYIYPFTFSLQFRFIHNHLHNEAKLQNFINEMNIYLKKNYWIISTHKMIN